MAKRVTKKSEQKPKPNQLSFELIRFDGDEELGPVDLRLDPGRDTIWANIEQLSNLFGRAPNTITEHIRHIFRDGELDEASVARKFRVTAKDGKNYSILHYNLDVILSVGYRISSRQATKFRQWATRILKAYIQEGYALNESRLADDPTALRKLAANVRRLRAEEKNIYQAVRDCFKICSVDYNAKAKVSTSFYGKLQDKFLFAITGKTASEIVIERADGLKEFMGLMSTRGGRPTKYDARIGKNYLGSDELYGLHLLCEQFLLFAESRAIAGQQLTMAEMDRKFDQLLEVQGYRIFRAYKSFLRLKARAHAEREFEVYQQRMRIESRNLDGTKIVARRA